MNTDNFGFEELELWKKASAFKNEIRLLTKQFPVEEKSDLQTRLSEVHDL